MFSKSLQRLIRAISSFNHATNRWAAVPLRGPNRPITQTPPFHPADAVGKQSLSLASWNIQASQSASLGPKSSDIIHLQEITSSVRRSLLDDSRVRSGFLTTDAEDDTSFKGRPFATMTLLSRERFGSPFLDEEGERGGKLMLDSVFRMELPSRYGRDALCVGIIAPAASGAVIRLLNVHLDSLNYHFRRELQMWALADLLREPGCTGGIIAGDFNAVAIFREDHELVDKYKLLGAWVALHGSTGSDGATWGVDVELEGELKPGRLDKVVMSGSVKPEEIEVLQPGLIGPGRPWSHEPWSDHCGLRCTFANM
ncbi:hypothetical protein PQX77_002478 [Marasmius sp. AFHP31]|nr:hypothetical protein PQX77_002478 [Marasmius sp. AFHP31]